MLLYLALLLFILISITNGKRNSEEEEICQTFLTSKSSAPISIHATNRNLKYDEDCEFSCELVLQDQELPIQIRYIDVLEDKIVYVDVLYLYYCDLLCNPICIA